MDIPLIVHVSGGAAGLVSGYAALWATKGRTTHRRAGVVFVVSMLVMGVTGALVAAAELSGNPGVGLELTVLAGLITAYLVVSGYTALQERPRREVATVMGLGVAIASTELALGLSALGSASGTRDGMPAVPYFIFGSVALLGVIGDARVLRSGAPTGSGRLRRHLWRMCTALLIAAFSFFLGQADEFPEALRIVPALLVPPFAVLAAMIYWLWRHRSRRGRGRAAPVRGARYAGSVNGH